MKVKLCQCQQERDQENFTDKAKKKENSSRKIMSHVKKSSVKWF